MASKKPQQSTSNPATAYAFMSIGALAVLGLVAWALNRSFNAPITSTTINAPVTNTIATAPPVTPNVDEELAKSAVPRITVDELKQELDRNAVTLVDVRAKEAFDTGHIKGAMHIPLPSTEAYLSYLPKDKPIVTYCT